MAQNVIINGVTYNAVPEVDIPVAGGGTAKFYDTSDADLTQASWLFGGVLAYGPAGLVEGTMPVNGTTGGTISTKAGDVTIPRGYTNGGTVQIDSAEQAKIIAGNIKSGVTILGVAGSLALPTISQDGVTKILSIS